MIESANWAARQARLLRPGRSVLARRWDRLEALLAVLAIGLCIAAIPVAVAIGSTVHSQQSALAQQQALQWHEATAITRMDAPAPASETPVQVMVPATWYGVDRVERTAPVAVDPATPAGSVVPIWLDREDRLTPPPASASMVLGAAVSAGLLTVIGCVLAVAAAAAVGRRLLDSRRAAAWAREWERFSGWPSRW